MQYPKQGHGRDQGPLLSDLRSLSEESDDDRNLQDDPEQRDRKAVSGEDRQGPPGFDLIEVLGDGCMIFGNSKSTDRTSIMVIPGFNDGAILEMGELGLLKGKGKEMYEKLKGLEG